MYQAKLMVLAMLCALTFMVMVASTGGTVNLTVGVTEVAQVEQVYGYPEYTYVGWWDGLPCYVYVYPVWGHYRHVYTYNGLVVHVEERW